MNINHPDPDQMNFTDSPNLMSRADGKIRSGCCTLVKKGAKIALTILDVQGQPNRVSPIVLEPADAIIVVFDASRGGSFDIARRWLQAASVARCVLRMEF